MLISLDLDGVLCDMSNAALTTAHAMHRVGLLADDDLRCIYLRALPKARPSDFAVSGEDNVVIITGRLPLAHGWTREWLALNGMGGCEVACVGDHEVEAIWARGEADGASVATAERKARACRRLGVELHIDNNPTVVREMRRLGVAAVCVRL